MEKEMSDGINIATVLMIIGFVLFASITIIRFSYPVTRSYTDKLNNVTSQLYSAEIESVGSYDGDLPAASLYVVFEKNKGAIDSISGTAYGVTVNKVSDLTTLFKHQIRVNIARVGDFYQITVRE